MRIQAHKGCKRIQANRRLTCLRRARVRHLEQMFLRKFSCTIERSQLLVVLRSASR